MTSVRKRVILGVTGTPATLQAVRLAVVPALLRLRLPHHADRGYAEAVALAAIAIHVPAGPELEVIPELGTGDAHAELRTYSLLLRAATLRAPVDPNHVVQAAGHAADQALRAEFGIQAGASAVLARTAEQLATCRRAVVGSPVHPGRR